MLLEHLVGIPDLHVFWEPDCPAEQYLHDSPFNSVRGPGPEVLTRRRSESYRSWKGRSRGQAHGLGEGGCCPHPAQSGGEACGEPGTARAQLCGTQPQGPFWVSRNHTVKQPTVYWPRLEPLGTLIVWLGQVWKNNVFGLCPRFSSFPKPWNFLNDRNPYYSQRHNEPPWTIPEFMLTLQDGHLVSGQGRLTAPKRSTM